MASETSAAWDRREAALRARSIDMGPAKWIDVDGIRTRYFERGSGAPVVFIHGGTVGSPHVVTDSLCWELNFPPLASELNCIAFDRLGQGFTDNPKSDTDYTMRAGVEHAVGFLCQLAKGPYHLVGHSRGGFLACRLAFDHPELIKTCTIVASGTLSPGVNRTALQLRNPPRPLKSRESMRWILQRSCYDMRTVTESWLNECVAVAQSDREKVATRKMVDERLDLTQYGTGLRSQRGEVYRWILDRGMPCPTLLVWGLNDLRTEFENAKLLVDMMMRTQPRTELRLFNKTGHYVFREQPEAFNGMLLDYVGQYN
jgi:pimeloyl-ACP methyl ester carboxylesterase